MMYTVSIVTITQGSCDRISFLEIQLASIIAQFKHYSNIIEWIIVNGSKNSKDATTLEEMVNTVLLQKLAQDVPSIKISYIRPETFRKIGALRNMANRVAKGEVIITMDDDDYYQPTYVSHIIEKFIQFPNHQLAGCRDIYVYNLCWRLLTQVDLKTMNHTCNNFFACKRTYAQCHSYDETVDFDEESSFLQMKPNSLEAKDPIIQLDPNKCGVHIIHVTNTVEKTRISLSPLYDVHYCTKLITDGTTVNDLVPSKILEKYESILDKNQSSPYDIVYYCGLWSVNFDPRDPTLGGSEQAVVALSKEWVKMGYKVAVYGEVPECIVDGVNYYPFGKFNPLQKFQTLILWRWYGIVSVLTLPLYIQHKNMMIDLHDNDKDVYRLISTNIHKYPNARVFFKSNYHLSNYEKAKKDDQRSNKEKVAIIMNGLRIDLFNKVPEPHVTRNPFRFCYTSCYTRGLERILVCFWPTIKKMEPRAELHLYYGMNLVNPEYANKLRGIISKTPGVCDHGRQSITLIAREKHMSTFHLYITDSDGEIDCISVRESLVAGCIPLLLNDAVFKERHGVHFEKDMPFDEIPKAILRLMYDSQKCKDLQKKLSTSDTIMDWNTIAKKWVSYM